MFYYKTRLVIGKAWIQKTSFQSRQKPGNRFWGEIMSLQFGKLKFQPER